jgi:asparagine synthetase B (glutamine-hydrolysing)
MAGIAGVKGADNGELARMLERIKHRGPHETWINQEQGVNLGCCELNMGGGLQARLTLHRRWR